jgi:hypothetical protein
LGPGLEEEEEKEEEEEGGVDETERLIRWSSLASEKLELRPAWS